MIVTCEKCGGNIDVARLRTSDGDVELAGVFSLHTSPLEARVCTQCGYTEFYAMRPHEISGPTEAPESPYAGYEE